MADDTYNGWTNRETWAVALHLSNDEGWDSAARAAAERFVNADGELSPEFRMAEWIERTWAEEVWEAAFNGADSSDFCGLVVQDVGSLWRVDFRKIAADYISEAIASVNA